MLIWVCILGSFLCYTLVGWQVFRTRNQLQSLSTHRSRDDAQRDDVRLPPLPSPPLVVLRRWY